MTNCVEIPQGLTKWAGFPDSNYVWEGKQLSWERKVKDENGKEKTIKTFRDPIEIKAKFQPGSKVYGFDNQGKIERAAVRKFGGALKGFVWLENVNGGGEVVLPFTAPHIFIATGDRLNPILTEIGTESNADNYYEVTGGKTKVFIKSFSGIGGAAGAPPTLIAHYPMNDNLATDVILDETGNHNGVVKDAGGTATSAFHSVAGKIIRAQDFDGTDDHIEITDHPDFTHALTPFSISAWIYMHDASSFAIASKGVYNTNAEWAFRVSSSDFILLSKFDESVDDCRVSTYYTSAITAYENQWIHVVGTDDGGTLYTGMNIYLNGVLLSQSNNNSVNASSFVSMEDLGRAVLIGEHGSSYSDGLIDNVAFFSRELDQFDVDFLYNMGRGTERWGEKYGTMKTTRTMRTGKL